MKRLTGLVFIFVVVSLAFGENEERLFHYIKSGHVDSIKQLLVIDPSLISAIDDQSGETPLITSVKAGQEEIARFFIDAGADVNATNILGETALMFAVEQGNENLVKLLLDTTHKGGGVRIH